MRKHKDPSFPKKRKVGKNHLETYNETESRGSSATWYLHKVTRSKTHHSYLPSQKYRKASDPPPKVVQVNTAQRA